jgi:rubrerythrin
MLGKDPIEMPKVPKQMTDMEIMRWGMMAELDAVNFYEQLMAAAQSPDVKKVLKDIAKEEKTHLAEFRTMLNRLDKEQVTEDARGEKEIEELTE